MFFFTILLTLRIFILEIFLTLIIIFLHYLISKDKPAELNASDLSEEELKFFSNKNKNEILEQNN